MSNFFNSIEYHNRTFEQCSKTDPHKIGKITIDHPWRKDMYRYKRPDKCDEYAEAINGCKKEILKTKLKSCKRNIKDKIEYKREHHQKCNFSLKESVADVPERNHNHKIEKRPYGSKEP
jgi:hypothetical protein